MKLSIKKSVSAIFFICLANTIIFAQGDLNKLTEKTDALKGGVLSIVNNIATIALLIGALYVVFALVSKPDQAKNSVLTFVVALIFKLVMFGFVGEL